MLRHCSFFIATLTVLFAMALSACKQGSPSSVSSLNADSETSASTPAYTTIQAGVDFITKAGSYDFGANTPITIELIQLDKQLHLSITVTRPNVKVSGGIGDDFFHTQAPWFVFAKSPHIFWAYNGINEVRLIKITDKGFEIIAMDTVAGKNLKLLPGIVRKRLPSSLYDSSQE